MEINQKNLRKERHISMRQNSFFYIMLKPFRLIFYLFYHWVDKYFTPSYGAYSAGTNTFIVSGYLIMGNIVVLFRGRPLVSVVLIFLYVALDMYFDIFYMPKITIEDLEYEYRKTNKWTKIILKTLLFTYIVVSTYTFISVLVEA